jgi:crossover junction endodeoxyribonuclease RusA
MVGGKPRVLTSREALHFKVQAGWLAKSQGIHIVTDLPMMVRARLYPSRPRDWQKREAADPDWWTRLALMDLDNALKITLDAMNGVAWRDDRQVVDLSIRRMYPDARPKRIELDIGPWVAPGAQVV